MGRRVGWRQKVQRVKLLRRGLEPGAGYQGQAAGLGWDRMETGARELGHRRATRGSGGDPNVVQKIWKLSEYCWNIGKMAKNPQKMISPGRR